ncbi:MAG: POTRA domain-containing protein [Vicinamibacterales bacterium]
MLPSTHLPARSGQGAALAAALIALLPWLGHAQSSPAAPYAGRPVASVRIEVEGRESEEPALADLVETKAGAPLSLQAVRESIAHLYSLRRFENVEVHAEDAGAGVALRYNLIPIHAVERVDFQGDLGLGKGDLRRHVVERFGTAPPAGRAAAAARALEQLLADRGYLRARVTPEIQLEHNPDRTVLIFAVEAGPRARVGTVAIDGIPDPERAAFAGRLGLVAGGVYDPFELERKITERVQDLRDDRYYEARVPYASRSRDDGTLVDVTVTVVRGPLVRVVYDGDPLPKDRLEDLVPIEREGSADQDLVEDSERRIAAYLHGQGYWKAQVSADRVERGPELLMVFLVSRGPKYVIDSVEISGNGSMPTETLQKHVHIERGSPFVDATLESDAAAIKELYRSQGFNNVAVTPARIEIGEAPVDGVGHIAVGFAIAEGTRTTVRSIRLDGNAGVSEGELRARMKVLPGQPYYVPAIAADRDAMLIEYANRGYQETSVQVVPGFSEDRTSAELVYRIVEGPVVHVDHILVVGNRRTSEETIRNELLVRPGDPLGYGNLLDSRRRLIALGLFRRVEITQVPHGVDRRDLIVTVDEAEPTTIGVGGGIEADTRTVLGANGLAEERIEVAPRGFFEIGRRNLGGKNRSINFSTRVSFRPRGETFAQTEGGGYGLNEYRVLTTYREPRAFGRRVDVSLVTFAEQAIRTTFNFRRIGFNADAVRLLSPRVRVNGRYSLGRTKLFDERIPPEDELPVDRLFPQVRLSSFAGALFRDTRDDILDPSRGSTQGFDAELAARAIGSELGFAKTFGQASFYRQLSRAPRIVFAGAARLGLAAGFLREVANPDAVNNPDADPTITVRELPASERFFAGGSTTVRGFAQDKLGASGTISDQGFPLGGNALIILNAEVRARLFGALDGAAFLDAGNVFEKASDIDLGEIRASVGVGLRYQSPIGPIRVDVGFKLGRRELSPGRFEAPAAFHLSVGQAF